MDAKTIAGAGMIIGGGLLGYRSMKELSGLGCYGPAGYLTLGLTAIGGGLYLFGKLRGEAIGEATQSIRDDIEAAMGAEVEYAGLPVISDSYGEESALDSGNGVPQWYGSAETEMAMEPVIANSYGESSALDSGNGVPQWYGSAETEEVGLPVIDNSFGENSALESGHGVPQWVGSAEARTVMTTKDGTRKYIRRNSKGQFTPYQVNIAGKKGAAAIDRRMGAKNYAKAGFRDQGDANPVAGANRQSRAEAFEASGYGGTGPRTVMTTKDGTRKYIRRNKKGQFTPYQVNIAGKKGSAAMDRRMKARSYAKSGYRDQGDKNPVGLIDRLSRNFLGAETEMAMEPVIPNSYGDNSALDSGNGVPVWYGSAEARTRMTTKDGTRRYVRRNKKGQFTSYQVNVDGKKGAIANDRRAKAKNYAKAGFRDQGDAKPVSQANRQR